AGTPRGPPAGTGSGLPAGTGRCRRTGAVRHPRGCHRVNDGERESGQRTREGGQRKPASASGETRRTVIVAGAANGFVGIIKLAAGLLTGSSAMLAEAAHSAADTLNQAFLLTSVRRGQRPADPSHPFGYGHAPH